MNKINEEDTEKDDDNVLISPVLKENPFLYLGFGINLYFDFLLSLMLTMGIICIFCMPIYKILGGFHNYQPDSWDIFSLGNLGQSSVQCSSSSLMADNFVAQCNTGRIMSLEYIELLPRNADDLSTCLPNADTNSCLSSLDQQGFTTFFNQKCLNKTS